MTSNNPIVDTYPSFLDAIRIDNPRTVEQWLACWAGRYMPSWPSLYEMVLADYEEQGEDWQRLALDRVFPDMNGRLPAIDIVYQSLGRIIVSIEKQARHALDFSGEVRYVLYIGLGNGAGWVTKYQGRPAVLFGLEGIVDSGFGAPDRLEGLVAHELGHVVHHSWREANGVSLGSGPWWQLYEEGFAQYTESKILARENWHMNDTHPGDDWLDWCQANQSWLAAEFLRRVDLGESVRPFFGSWFDVKGRKQTGYYLGRQAINHLVSQISLREIALLGSGAELERILRSILSEFVNAEK